MTSVLGLHCYGTKWESHSLKHATVEEGVRGLCGEKQAWDWLEAEIPSVSGGAESEQSRE